MPQYLSGITEPFAVLRGAWLVGLYLAGSYEILELLLAADDAHGIFLPEGEVRHYIEDVLQQYCLRIHLCNVKSSHRLFDSYDIDALVFHVGTGYPLLARLYTFIKHGGTWRVPDGIRIVGKHGKRDDFTYIQVAELLRNASAGGSYCFLHIFVLKLIGSGNRLCSDDLQEIVLTLY